MANSVDFVIDGDTTYNSESRQKRRLFGINAPEIGRAGDTEAGARLGQLLAENPNAIWEAMDKDIYGREVGRWVTPQGQDLNEVLVREGYVSAMDFGGNTSPYHQAQADYVRELRDGSPGYSIQGNSFFNQEEELTFAQEFGEGVLRGVDQTQGLLGFGISALAQSIGMDSLADYGEELALRNFEEAQEHAPTINSYTDIDFDDGILEGLSNAGRFAIGILGEQTPQIGFDILAGLGTGGLGLIGKKALEHGVKKGVASHIANAVSKSSFNKGLFGSMSLQQIGEVEAELNANGIEAPLTSIVTGLGAGSVDFLGAKVLLGSASRLYNKGQSVSGAELLSQGLANTSLEGATEGLQTLMAKSAVLYHNSGYDLFSKENVEEMFNAIIAGAIIGGTPSTVKGGIQAAQAGVSKLSRQDISAQNAKVLDTYADSSQYNSDEDLIVLAGRATLEDGTAVEVGEEVVPTAEVGKAKAKMQERAGDVELTFTENTPEEVQAIRSENNGTVTDNQDYITEPLQQQIDQSNAVENDMKPSALVTEEAIQKLQQTKAESLDKNDMHVVRTDDGRTFLVKGEVQAQAVAEHLKESAPIISKATDPAPDREVLAREEERAATDEPKRESGKPQSVPFVLEDSAEDSVNPAKAEEQNSAKEVVNKVTNTNRVETGPENEESSQETSERQPTISNIVTQGIASFSSAAGLNPDALADAMVDAVKDGRVDTQQSSKMLKAIKSYREETGDRFPTESERSRDTEIEELITETAAKVEAEAKVKEPYYDDYDYTKPSDEVASEFLKDSALESPAVTDPEIEHFRKALQTGLEAAHQTLKKRELFETPEEDFADLGFKSQGEMVRAKRAARKTKTWIGKLDDNVAEAMLMFEKDGKLAPVYLPRALMSLHNSPLRFNTASDTSNFAARMQDFLTDFLAFSAENGYVPVEFPTAKDNKIHIAFRPKGNRGNRDFVMTMQDIQESAFRKATNRDFPLYSEVLQEEQSLELEGMYARLDSLIEEHISKIKAATESNKDEQAIVENSNKVVNKFIDKIDETKDAMDDRLAEVLEDERRSNQELSVGTDSIEAEVSDPTRTANAPAPTTGVVKPRTFKQKTETLVRNVAKAAGIKTNIVIAETRKGVANVRIVSGDAIINLNLDKLREISDSNPDLYFHIIAHEVGHAFTAETMHNLDAESLAELHKAFKKDKAKSPSGHPYRRDKGVGFDEWLADQFALYFSKAKADKKAKAQNKTIKLIADTLAKIANAFGKLFGINRAQESLSGQAFMESMFKAGIQNKITSEPEFQDSLSFFNLQFGGTRPRSRAEDKRYSTELKALRKPIDGIVESSINRDYTLGQALNDTSDMGRAAIHSFGKVGKSIITEPGYIGKKANAMIDSVREYAPMLFTTHNQLKHIAGAQHMAKIYRRIFDHTVSDSAIWQNEVAHVFEKVSEDQLKAFVDGRSGIPKPIADFMDKFHKRLSQDMPTLGYIKGYFTRAYDIKAVEQNRAKLEEILIDHAAKAGIASFTEENAKAAVDSILQDPNGDVHLLGDAPAVFGNDPFAQKTRILTFIPDEVLRSNGFLRSDVDAVLSSYVHRMLRRANYEKEMSRYTKITDTDEVRKAGVNRKKAISTFTKNLFVGLPFRSDNGRLFTDEEKYNLFGLPDEEFFQRNRKFYHIAKENNWIKEIDTDSGKEWAFYDKNAVVRDAFKSIERPADKVRFVKIVDALEGRLGADKLSPKTRDAMSTALAYQNLVILPFSGFAQLAEVSGLVFRGRDMDGVFEALNEIRTLLFTSEGRQRRALMRDLGFAQKQLAQQAILESYGVNYQSPMAQKMNDFLFTANGMNFLTNSSRILGAAIAERFIQRHARKAQEGDSRSIRYLEELGLTPEQANYAISDRYKTYNEFITLGDLESYDSLNSKAVHDAMFKFVDTAIVRPNATQRPAWASDPRFMLVWHLKSFMYAYGSAILGGLGREMSARYKEGGLSKAAIPFMIYSIPVLLMSGLALELRELLQHRILGLGSRPYSDNLYGADYIMELVKRGGALGPMEMAYSFTEDMDRGRSPMVGLLGPTAQQLDVLLDFDLADSINRSTPILAQNPLFRDWVREVTK